MRALAPVGSWAQGAPSDEPDLDVVPFTDSPDTYVHQEDWLREVGGAHLVQTLGRGAVGGRRFALRSGLEVELAVGILARASVDPLDPGPTASSPAASLCSTTPTGCWPCRRVSAGPSLTGAAL